MKYAKQVKTFFVVLTALGPLAFSQGNVFASDNIKVCHCSGSKVESTEAGLDNQDGKGHYHTSTIERGNCSNKECTITACFGAIKHYELDSWVVTENAQVPGGEIAFGWEDAPEGSRFAYQLSVGAKCH